MLAGIRRPPAFSDDTAVPQQHEAVDFVNLAFQRLDKLKDGSGSNTLTFGQGALQIVFANCQNYNDSASSVSAMKVPSPVHGGGLGRGFPRPRQSLLADGPHIAFGGNPQALFGSVQGYTAKGVVHAVKGIRLQPLNDGADF